MNNLMTTHKRVLVLDETVAVSELNALAATSGWTLAGRFPGGFEDSVELQWTTDDGVDIAYIEHHPDAVRLVAIRGDDGDAVTAVSEAIGGAVPGHTEDSLLDELLRDPEPLALVRTWRGLTSAMAHASPDHTLDERLATALERDLRHDNRQVRLRALMVADALGGRWPQLLDLVLARKGEESELAYVVDAFASLREEDTDD